MRAPCSRTSSFAAIVCTRGASAQLQILQRLQGGICRLLEDADGLIDVRLCHLRHVPDAEERAAAHLLVQVSGLKLSGAAGTPALMLLELAYFG